MKIPNGVTVELGGEAMQLGKSVERRPQTRGPLEIEAEIADQRHVREFLIEAIYSHTRNNDQNVAILST